MADAKTEVKPSQLAKQLVEALGNRAQRRIAALVGRPWFWVFAVTLIFLFPLGSALQRRVPPPLPKQYQLPPFTLVSERGQPFGSEELKGHIWVADFIYTTCAGPCPKLTKRMAEIQHRARNMGDALRLVTFTADPENDTPEVLAAYARKSRANPRRWTFLTGPLADLETLAVKGFKEVTGKKDALSGLLHSEHLFLVDPAGWVRGHYDATDEGIAALLHDMRILANVP
jgi:protein SCO1